MTKCEIVDDRPGKSKVKMWAGHPNFVDLPTEQSLTNKAGQGLPFFSDVPSAWYHAGPGVSRSCLNYIQQSPLTYWYHRLSGLAVQKDESDVFRFGRAFHTMALEPDIFFDEWVTLPNGINKRTKEGKAEMEAFEKEAQGKSLLTIDEFERVSAMADKLMKSEKVRNLLAGGSAEMSFYCPMNNYTLGKCRPDFTRGDGILVDLKTSTDATPRSFQKSSWDFRYHVQAAWYLDIVSAVLGQRYNKFMFVVIEKSPPYEVSIFLADAYLVERGRQEYKNNLDTLAVCQLSGRWPGYSEEIQVLTVPRWAEER